MHGIFIEGEENERSSYLPVTYFLGSLRIRHMTNTTPNNCITMEEKELGHWRTRVRPVAMQVEGKVMDIRDTWVHLPYITRV
jgi:hypothetical protein